MTTLLELIEREGITELERRGREYHGHCPLCGNSGNSFVVFSGGERFLCRSCDRYGFSTKFVMLYKNYNYGEARDYLNLPRSEWSSNSARTRLDASFNAVEAPCGNWLNRAVSFAEECRVRLWQTVGEKARLYLRGRLLTDETIRLAGLGYNVADRWVSRAAWGLPEEIKQETGKPKGLWLPRGIVIPWIIDGKLAAIRVRRPAAPGDKLKYYMIPGSMSNPLYNADAVTAGAAVALVEGEFDALTALQFASDLAVPVATGGTHSARRVRWLSRLSSASAVLVAYDRDEGGGNGASYWLRELKNARRWAPPWDDLNGFAGGGGDVRSWVEAGMAP